MRRATSLALAALLLTPAALDAQASKPRTTATKKPPAKAPAKAAPAPKREPAQVKCPAVLGTGVKTQRSFCDVLTGRDPAQGIVITLPPHTGEATVSFDLHNRHTYSEEEVRARRAFGEYTATIGVLTPAGDLLTRATVYSTFRNAGDLVDRVSGGAGPGGVKAVAPTGTESITVVVPKEVNEVSLLGERLVVRRLDGEETFTSQGRPIAIASNAMVEFTPVPAKKAPAKKTTKKAPAKKR
jgi:hypothetical protein